MDIKKLAAGAVKAVEGHIIGVDGGAAAGPQEGRRTRGGESNRRIQRDMLYSRGKWKE